MIVKVTHIDERGHRHRAHVSARNVADALEQMDREFGEARGGAAIRMRVAPVLHLVPRRPDADPFYEGRRNA